MPIIRKISELIRLVKSGEGFQMEFKLKANHPEKILKEIAAFANTSGGLLIIGVSDDGQIIGSPYASEDEFQLNRFIENNISPPIAFESQKFKLTKQKEILVYSIEESRSKPHSTFDGKEKKVFVRYGDKSIQASKEVREILKGQTKNRNLRFTYGQKETVLMKYLEKNKKITLTQFSEIANIPIKQASRTLILLVLTSVLFYQAREKEDWFFKT